VVVAWQGQLAKLHWWEFDDWSMGGMMLTAMTLPALLVGLAGCRRLVEVARTRVAIPGWLLRVAGLPLLWFPGTFLRAWSWGAVPPEAPEAPTTDVYFDRIAWLATWAAVATVVAAWPWVASRPTPRGWLRFAAFAVLAAVALPLLVAVLVHFRALRLQDLAMPVAMQATLLLACGVVLVTTGSREEPRIVWLRNARMAAEFVLAVAALPFLAYAMFFTWMMLNRFGVQR
jgi:hypothetical protein